MDGCRNLDKAQGDRGGRETVVIKKISVENDKVNKRGCDEYISIMKSKHGRDC